MVGTCCSFTLVGWVVVYLVLSADVVSTVITSSTSSLGSVALEDTVGRSELLCMSISVVMLGTISSCRSWRWLTLNFFIGDWWWWLTLIPSSWKGNP